MPAWRTSQHCFRSQNSNFKLSIQIIDSRGIHWLPSTLRTQRREANTATSNRIKHYGEFTMKTKLIAAVLIAASATLAAPAFASGYGPAPHYSPSVGAPASQ